MKHIFPEIECNNYIERNYAIRRYLKVNNNYLYKYTDTWGETEKTLLNTYGIPYPIEPMKFFLHNFPIAVSKTGEIICLPKFSVCPSIMVYGRKRTGKTLLCHRIVEAFYWWFRYKVFIGNDYQNEVFAWASPCRSFGLYKQFVTFGEVPAPLPIFLIMPNSSRDLGMKKLKTAKMVMTLPIEYLVKNIEDFVNLDKSEGYFKSMDFTGCKSKDDVKNRIIDNLKEQGVKEKMIASMTPKINNMMEFFIDDGMLSFSNRVIKKLYLQNDNTTDFPIVQLLKVGMIPNLITTQIKSKKWFPNYIKAVFNQVIEFKQDNKDFKKTNLLVFMDELNKILVDEKIIDSIGTSIAQGGMLNIAFLGAAHHPSEIDIRIRGNCQYVFCFNINENKDVNRIKMDYHLDSKQANLIKELKTFEFIGKSKEQKFVIYDPKHNLSYETDFVHGFLIPPISHHLPPESSKLGEFMSQEKYNTTL
ncbi:MAG: hypothetical protein AABY07_00025, partial [Nanoarchaeota archaeon]